MELGFTGAMIVQLLSTPVGLCSLDMSAAGQRHQAHAEAPRRWRHAFAVLLISSVIVHGTLLWKERKQIVSGYGDFAALYTGGSIVARGLGHQLYDDRTQWKIQQEFAKGVNIRRGPLPFIRPPFDALVFVPFSWLWYPVAVVVWSLLNLGLLLLAIWILQRPLGRTYSTWFEALLTLGLFPVFLNLLLGQDSIMLLLLFVLAFNAARANRNGAAGIWLGFGLFKPNLTLPMVLLLSSSGRWRILKGFLPVGAGLVICSLLIGGPETLVSYPAHLLAMNRATGIAFIHTRSMPNARGLLVAVSGLFNAGASNWVLLAIAIAAIWWVSRISSSHMNDSTGFTLGYCLCLLVSILISYYVYLYDLTLLVLPLLLLSANFLKTSDANFKTRMLIFCGLLLVLSTPIYAVLFYRLDRCYLLSLPIVLVAAGLIRVIRFRRNAGGSRGDGVTAMRA